MGFQDRQYNRNDEGEEWKRGGAPGSPGYSQRSIITTLIIINVIVFVIDTFTPLVDATVSGTHWLNYYVMGVNPDRPWAIWSYLTYGFAHAALDSKISFFHLAFNMLGLFFFGNPVIQKIGRNEFLKFYLLSIVASGIGYMIIAQIFQLESYVVGASGAVSAVIFLFVFLHPGEKIMFWGLFPMYTWVLGVLCVVLDLRHALVPDSHVAWQVHLVGALFALAYFKLNWNFERLPLPAMPAMKSGPKLRVHDPEAAQRKLDAEGDRILAKISEQGKASLTRAEKKTLEKYSKSLRNRD